MAFITQHAHGWMLHLVHRFGSVGRPNHSGQSHRGIYKGRRGNYLILMFLFKFLSGVDKKAAESFSYKRGKADWVSQPCIPPNLLVTKDLQNHPVLLKDSPNQQVPS